VNVAIRVAGFWLGYSAIFIGLGLVLGMAPPAVRMLVAGTLITLGSLALTYAFTSSERTSLSAVGARWSAGSERRFLAGFAFGCGMVFLLVALCRVVLGPLTFVRVPAITGGTVALMCVTFLMLSAGEELGFRGYPFQRLRQRYGTAIAQVVVALAFAAYHMLQGWPLANALIGTTAGSVLFCVATMASGGLAFPIGVHAAWNIGSWMLGTKDDAGYWRMDIARPPSFVAGALVYLAVMLLATATLWWWMRRRRRLIAALA
jgi:membrane protease YdiL (CAAX protease family)